MRQIVYQAFTFLVLAVTTSCGGIDSSFQPQRKIDTGAQFLSATEIVHGNCFESPIRGPAGAVIRKLFYCVDDRYRFRSSTRLPGIGIFCGFGRADELMLTGHQASPNFGTGKLVVAHRVGGEAIRRLAWPRDSRRKQPFTRKAIVIAEIIAGLRKQEAIDFRIQRQEPVVIRLTANDVQGLEMLLRQCQSEGL